MMLQQPAARACNACHSQAAAAAVTAVAPWRQWLAQLDAQRTGCPPSSARCDRIASRQSKSCRDVQRQQQQAPQLPTVPCPTARISPGEPLPQATSTCSNCSSRSCSGCRSIRNSRSCSSSRHQTPDTGSRRSAVPRPNGQLVSCIVLMLLLHWSVGLVLGDQQQQQQRQQQQQQQQQQTATAGVDHVKLQRTMMEALGIRKLPDMAKVNISHHEYRTKMNEYLVLRNRRERRKATELGQLHRHHPDADIQLLSIRPTNLTAPDAPHHLRRARNVDGAQHHHSSPASSSSSSSSSSQPANLDHVFVHFNLPEPTSGAGAAAATGALPPDIEDAMLKLLVRTHPLPAAATQPAASGQHTLSVYQLLANGRRHLLGQRHFHLAAAAVADRHRQQHRHHHHHRHQHHRKHHGHPQAAAAEAQAQATAPAQVHNQFIEVHVTEAVRQWRRWPATNRGLQLECAGCAAAGMHIVHAASPFEAAEAAEAEGADAPELFIVASRRPTDPDEVEEEGGEPAEPEEPVDLGESGDDLDLDLDLDSDLTDADDSVDEVSGNRLRRRQQRQAATRRHGRYATNVTQGTRPYRSVTRCRHRDKRCCHHKLDVEFKKIPGMEWVEQPVHFDAGNCKGQCPMRYLPASQHVVLMLMLVPINPYVHKPCCAPSRLEDVDVLYVDGGDETKMNIMTWTNMRALECACT